MSNSPSKTSRTAKSRYAPPMTDRRLRTTRKRRRPAQRKAVGAGDKSARKLLSQRNAELAIINSVQAALAAELNIQGIYDAVGDKIREIFHNRDMEIRIYDPRTNLIHYPYHYENGKRVTVPSNPLSERGVSAHILRTRETLVFNEGMAEAYEKYGAWLLPGTKMEKSSVYVPLVAAGQARGLICLMDMRREHAFSDDDVRLLQTLAGSMGVALESARLFDDTQRLLKETEQRNAELAIINSVQAALAAKLDIQGIYYAVGDKIREIFQNRDVEIRIYDPRTNLVHFPYHYEGGKRIAISSGPLPARGFFAHILRTREAIVVNENMAQAYEKYGAFLIPGTQQEKSSVYVPLVAAGQARGLIGLVDLEREHAFSDSDVRLLQTLANSMSVALENARLFDETQRLLKETEQRAAELAVINSIQEGIAAKLDFQAIVDLVGDKLREVFASGDIGINWHDKSSDRIHYLYQYEHGTRLRPPSVPSSASPSWSILSQRRRPIVGRTTAELDAIGFGNFPGTDPCLSAVYVPIIGKDGLLGVIYIGSFEREDAFGDAAVRLLGTVAASMGVALENAQLFDETQRRSRETTALVEVGRDISSTLELATVMDRIARHAMDLLHADNSAIFLPDLARRSYRAITAVGDVAEQVKAMEVHEGEGIVGSILQAGNAEFV